MKKYVVYACIALSCCNIAARNHKNMKIKQQGLEQEKEPNIGISAKDRQVSIDILNQILADEYVLLVQTLNYHWNIVGPEFNDYHKLFGDQYAMIFELVDGVAERVRIIGGIALGSMAQFIKNANLKEDSGDIPAPRQMVKNLLAQHEELIRTIRKGINATAKDERDMGTSDFLTCLIQKHEKTAWMLRALSQR